MVRVSAMTLLCSLRTKILNLSNAKTKQTNLALDRVDEGGRRARALEADLGAVGRHDVDVLVTAVVSRGLSRAGGGGTTPHRDKRTGFSSCKLRHTKHMGKNIAVPRAILTYLAAPAREPRKSRDEKKSWNCGQSHRRIVVSQR